MVDKNILINRFIAMLIVAGLTPMLIPGKNVTIMIMFVLCREQKGGTYILEKYSMKSPSWRSLFEILNERFNILSYK